MMSDMPASFYSTPAINDSIIVIFNNANFDSLFMFGYVSNQYI